jgi:hypothetical protein
MLPSGHYTAALSIPYIKSEAFDFLEKRFAPVADKSPLKSAAGLTKVQPRRR